MYLFKLTGHHHHYHQAASTLSVSDIGFHFSPFMPIPYHIQPVAVREDYYVIHPTQWRTTSAAHPVPWSPLHDPSILAMYPTNFHFISLIIRFWYWLWLSVEYTHSVTDRTMFPRMNENVPISPKLYLIGTTIQEFTDSTGPVTVNLLWITALPKLVLIDIIKFLKMVHNRY